MALLSIISRKFKEVIMRHELLFRGTNKPIHFFGIICLLLFVLNFIYTQYAGWPFTQTLMAADAKIAASAPIIGRVTRIYDAAQGTMPDAQNMTYVAQPSTATETFTNGTTVLDTTLSQTQYAGYTLSNPVPLSRTLGYALRVGVQVQAESHGDNNRAGYSIIVLSSDKIGIELGFWADSIWAQEGGLPPDLFTRAEAGAHNTTTGVIDYDLVVLDDSYTLQTADAQIVAGLLRDYTAFMGVLDPYEAPNFIFLGDDTTSAAARIALESVALIRNETPISHTVDAETDLIIDDIGIMDADGAGTAITVTLSVANGILTVPSDSPAGLTARNISGNGTNMVTLTGSPVAINNTLASRVFPPKDSVNAPRSSDQASRNKFSRISSARSRQNFTRSMRSTLSAM